MRVDGYCPSFSRHLEPRKINLVLNAELGLTVGNDAAVYISAVLQYTVERLVAGALSSCDKADFRSEASTHMDVKPRHLQDYIRTNEDMWVFFNSAFAFQVILSVFLDHATEVLFDRLGLPIHSKEALAASEYYKTVVDGLQHIKPAQPCCIISSNSNKDLPPSLTTPAQMARIVAGVNPLCSMSPKACLMMDALVHETFMALCEGIARRRPDSRVITIADLEEAIRDFFPQGLASQATRAANAAVLSLAEGQALRPGSNTVEGGSLEGGVPDERVTLCLRRLQGTRTVLRKTFKVAPGNLLFAVFRKACDRLRLPEGSVVFVHDGAILSGRREAGTLASGPGCQSVQVFAVCKKDWACKQREAARRGFLMGQGKSLDPLEATKRSRSQLHGGSTHKGGPSHLYQSASVPGLRKPWKQEPRHPASYDTTAARGPYPGQPEREGKHQPSRVLPPLPDGLGASKEMLRGWGADIVSEPRRARRWIETPDDGAKVDLARLENTRPLPPRPLGAFRSQLPESVPIRALVGSDKEGGEGVSPRIGRTVRRLADMEACLRNLDDSMRELQAGDPGGSSTGVPTIALAAINSQLDVAYNLSSLCRQVLSATQGDSNQEGDPAKDHAKLQNPLDSSLTAHAGARNNRDLPDTLGGTDPEHHRYLMSKLNQVGNGGDSFLTEVPSGDTLHVDPLQSRLLEGAPHAAQGNNGSNAIHMPPVADARGPVADGATIRRTERGPSDGQVQADGVRLPHDVNSSGGTHGDVGGRAVVDEAAQGQVQPPPISGVGHGHRNRKGGSFEGLPHGHVGGAARDNVEPRGGLVSSDEHERERPFGSGGRDAYYQEGNGGGRYPVISELVPLPEQTGHHGEQASGKVRPGDAHVDIRGRGGVVQPGGRPSLSSGVGQARALHALPLDRELASTVAATTEQGPEVQGLRQPHQRQPVARETVPPAVGAERPEDGKGQAGGKTGGPSVGVKGHTPDSGLLGVKELPRVLPLDDYQQQQQQQQQRQQTGGDDGQGSDDEYLEGDDDHDEGGGGGGWSSWLT